MRDQRVISDFKTLVSKHSGTRPQINPLTNYNITVIFIFRVQIDPFTQIRTGLDGDAALTAGDQRHVIGKVNVVTQRDELWIDDFDACADPYVASGIEPLTS